MGVTHPSALVQGSWLRGEVEHLAGSARLRPAAPWELAVEHRTAFADGLTQLGLNDEDRADALRVRDTVAGEVLQLGDEYAAIARAAYRPAPVREAIAILEERRTAHERLAAWFADRRFEVRARATTDVRIPLFVIAAPDVAGCRTELWPTGTPAAALSARFTLFGTGGGGGATGLATITDGVCTGPGTSRLVFVPVKVTVAKVTVYGNQGLAGQGLQVSITGAPRTAGTYAVQLEADTPSPIGRRLQTCAHRNDAPDICAYERIPAHAPPEIREVRLPITIEDMEAVVTAAVALSGPVTIAADLAGGHDYDLHDLAQGHGIGWRTQ
jgi:hypothetical protein